MNFSPSTFDQVLRISRDERHENRITTQDAIAHHAQQAVIAYRNLSHWPEREAVAALDYAISQLAILLKVPMEARP